MDGDSIGGKMVGSIEGNGSMGNNKGLDTLNKGEKDKQRGKGFGNKEKDLSGLEKKKIKKNKIEIFLK